MNRLVRLVLSPDERARVEAQAVQQLVVSRLTRSYDTDFSGTPWFRSAHGPIWLTPADRAFLKGHRISDQ